MWTAEVNGKSQNCCVHGMVKLYKEKNRTGETCSARERDMEVFSNDFAAVYFREKLCYDDLTEYGTISGEIWKTFIG